MNLYTRQLPLAYGLYDCVGGPCDGTQIALTEHDNTSAWIDWNGRRGRYEWLYGRTLKWETGMQAVAESW